MKKLFLALMVMFSVGVVNAQSKVAHVNSQKLLDTLPSRKEALKNFRNLSQMVSKNCRKWRQI